MIVDFFKVSFQRICFKSHFGTFTSAHWPSRPSRDLVGMLAKAKKHVSGSKVFTHRLHQSKDSLSAEPKKTQLKQIEINWKSAAGIHINTTI